MKKDGRKAPAAFGPAGPTKRILYYASEAGRAEHFFASLREVPGVEALPGPERRFRYATHTLVFSVRTVPCEAFGVLHEDYFNLVLLDLRLPEGRQARGALKPEAERVSCILDKLDAEPDVELRYGFHRIVVLVSGPDSTEVDDLIASLGARGVGRVMRDTATCHLDPSCPRLPHHSTFSQSVLDQALALMQRNRGGTRALCCAGGGITGIYFELGALKCLEDCLSPGAINSFDQYYGISAGAVVTGFLANGYSVSEVMGGLAGEPGGRIPPFSLSLLRAPHLNLAAFVDPVRRFLGGAATGAFQFLLGERRVALESIFLQYSDLLVAPFTTEAFGEMMEQVFTTNGARNDFKKLRRPLYIGATDQDTREHVLFGEPPFDRVPVSQAIQASISINPAFCATRIGDRYYVDGIVTRTSNFIEAMKKGSNLIFAIDPFVPFVPKRPGWSHRKGILFAADQDIRTVSFTRFETTRYWVLRRHPEVSLYSFLPANRIRKVMSVNPMDHRPYLQIWRGAYLSTLQRILKVQHRMRGDISYHGLTLETARAEEIARRLDSVVTPRFADFFVDGRVDVRPPAVPRARLRPERPARAPKGLGPAFHADAA